MLRSENREQSDGGELNSRFSIWTEVQATDKVAQILDELSAPIYG